MINRLLVLPDNPVFLYDLMSVRGIRDKAGLIHFTWRVVLLLMTLLFLVIGFAYAFNVATGSASWIEVLFFVGAAFFGVIIYTSFIPDMAAIFFSLNTINSEYQSDRIDLLRTSMGEVELVRAKHALAVVRSWRLMIYWFAARVIILLLYSVIGILILFDGSIWQEIPPEFAREVPLLLIIWIPMVLFSALVMLLEPIWRMRVITAIGVFVSAKTESRITALIFGILGMFALSISLGIVSSLLGIPLSMLFGLSAIIASENEALFMVLLRVFIYVILPLLSVAGSVGLYFFYRFIRRWLLEASVKALERR